MTMISRRHFIYNIIALSGATADLLASPSRDFQKPKPHTNQLILSCEKFKLYDRSLSSLGIYNFKNNNYRSIAIPFLGHSLIPSPLYDDQIIYIGQRPSLTSCLVSISESKIIQKFSSQSDFHFYGHGAFSNNKNYFFTTEHNHNNPKGIIAIRNTTDYKIEDQLNTYGLAPHEFVITNDNKNIITTNGGTHSKFTKSGLYIDSYMKNQPSNLSIIDISTKKLVDQYHIPFEGISLRHLKVLDDNNIIIALKAYVPNNGHHPPAAIFNIKKGHMKYFHYPPNIKPKIIYSFDIAIDSRRNILGLSHPISEMISFWDIQSRKLISIHKINKVKGLIYIPDKDYFFITRKTAGPLIINAQTKKIVQVPNIKQGLNDGHLNILTLTYS